VGGRLFALLGLALVAAAAPGIAAAHTDGELTPAQEWWLTAVGADQSTPPGPGVPISIIDSGVDATQEEFANRPNTTYENPQTTFGREEFHGTAVASVAAAPVNGVGIVGVYPQAALQIWDASSSARGITDFTALAAVDAAAQHCPAVINLSFGSTDPDPELEDALLHAFRNGCLVVAAAGNAGQDGNPTTYPADWPHVFTVGAIDQTGKVASFSTTGPGLDIVAPGDAITAAVPTTENATGYETLSGTSFAAPIVSAAAAWIWTLRPTLTPSQLEQLLRNSAKDLGPPGYDTASGYGLLDIPAALAAPTPPDDPGEPNDDINQVKPGALFPAGERALTTKGSPSARISATLADTDDPRDVYRIWVPARKVVHIAVSSGGNAAARIWGPKTVSTSEGLAARRRDLRGQEISGGKSGSAAYVEVLLTGRSDTASYTLTVTASKH
jgi:subtilisin family serine protease